MGKRTQPYKTISVFDEISVPEVIRSEHRTKAGTWGLLRVLEGRVTLIFTDPRREVEATPDHPVQIPPQETHLVRIDGPARLQVEFYREPPLETHSGEPMGDLALARAIHVVAIVFWIGGVTFVTLVVLPWVRHTFPPSERLLGFQEVEGRFAPQARIWVALAGLSGFWIVYRADLWGRVAEPEFWWMNAVLLVWLIFSGVLYIAEPLFLHRRMTASPTPEADFSKLELAHRVLLGISVVATFGAVGGTHGLF